MRPAEQPAGHPPPVDELIELAEPFGVTHTGVARAAVLERARSAIHHRIAAGFADEMQFTFKNPERSTDPGAAVRDAEAIFVAARPYLLDDPGDAPEQPAGRIARYAWVDHYAPLREALWAVAQRLRADGWKAVPFADDNSIVDRDVAYEAGIGWYGKNANLLLPGAGSWFVLGCVVTTAPLPPTRATVPDGCGTCGRCVDACPTGAIVAPGVIDGRRCLAWVLQKPGPIPEALREAVGDRLYGCDDCQDVCPPTIRFGRRRMSTSDVPPRAWMPLLDLLTADDDGVLAQWGRWYLADRDPRWARRNALVVLGNTADPSDARVRAVLADYRADADPVLGEHAHWASRRLGLLDP